MSTENIKLGVCNVFFDGVDLGLTKGGVEVSVSTETYEVTVDQYGATPVDELIRGRSVMARVPLVETTLENMTRIMPGSRLITDGAFSTGTVTFTTSAPVSGDYVEVMGQRFTFRTNPTKQHDVAIPADINAAGEVLADEINGAVIPVYATVTSAGEVTITANSKTADSDVAINVSGTNITATGMTGGADPTSARVDVTTGINISMLEISKKLLLRPIGTLGEDDFIIHKAATAGALDFSYSTDSERIYNTEFKGYISPDGGGFLFSVGDEAAN